MSRCVLLLAVLACSACGDSAVPGSVERRDTQAAACAGPAHAGGDWPVAGRDLANSRNQEQESVIGPDTVSGLAAAWRFDTGAASGVVDGGAIGAINSTPTIAGRCLYVSSNASTPDLSNVFALDADSGAVVWEAHAPVEPAGADGAIIGSPVVSGERLIVLVNQAGDGPTLFPESGTTGPYVMAFDRHTGTVLWRSPPIVTGGGYYSHATPAITRGAIVAGFSPPEGDPLGQGGVAIVDEETGALLARVYTVPAAEQQIDGMPGFAGGGVWTTPAADDDGYAYYGTGNPFSKRIEHANTNAILKLDLVRSRPTFGTIVASYKGDVEQLNDLIVTISRPTCLLLGDFYVPGSDLGPCLQLDLDFGASPNLFRGPDGRMMVGDLQKSGVYHVAYTDDMTRAWTRLLGISCQLCNAASTAFDASRDAVFVNVTPVGLMASTSTAGALNWYAPDLSGVNYAAVSTANGVVYLVDTFGTLLALSADTGRPLFARPTALDGAVNAQGLNSAGIAIARNTVYVPAGSSVVAYRLP